MVFFNNLLSPSVVVVKIRKKNRQIVPVLFVRRRLVIVWCFSSTCHGGQLDSLLRKSQDTQSRSYLAVSRLCVVVRSSVRPTAAASERADARRAADRTAMYCTMDTCQLYFVWLLFNCMVILGVLWLIFRTESFIPGVWSSVCPSDRQPTMNGWTRRDQPIALHCYCTMDGYWLSFVWSANLLFTLLYKVSCDCHLAQFFA